MNFDRLLFTYLYEATPPWFALPITYLGTWGSLWILISVVLIACDRGPRRRTGVALLAGIAVSHLLVDLTLKPIVSRVRPCEVLDLHMYDAMTSAQNHSFPSGHASMAFACAWILGAHFRTLRLPLLILATAIALSRVVVGAHWPSDVAVGSIIGLMIGIGVVKGFGSTICTPPISTPGSDPKSG